MLRKSHVICDICLQPVSMSTLYLSGGKWTCEKCRDKKLLKLNSAAKKPLSNKGK